MKAPTHLEPETWEARNAALKQWKANGASIPIELWEHRASECDVPSASQWSTYRWALKVEEEIQQQEEFTCVNCGCWAELLIEHSFCSACSECEAFVGGQPKEGEAS